jgi:Ca2+-binding RTX toxin-like protein
LSAEGVTVDLADASAGGGDALGDSFSGVEIVQGSYHDDIIRGNEQDNRLRGGIGSDILDGRGGFDTADYSKSDEAVAIDLSLGRGLEGIDASGDILISIEKLLGSVFADTFIGSSGSDTFDAGYGQDQLRGGFGSDYYILGFDSDNDTVTELGDAADIDRVLLKSSVSPKDVSVVRQGNDLLIELENIAGVLTFDTMLVKDHFLGTATGIEEIVFGNGIIWNRDRIEALARIGRFNAEDDVFLFGVEDQIAIIDPATLLANDAEEGAENLRLISVSGSSTGTASIRADGKIAFLANANYNGQGYFEYVVGDEYGRESTGRVRVNIAAVNDAPVAVGDPSTHGFEDQLLRIHLDDFLKANDYDIDNDWEDLRIVGIMPLFDENGSKIDPFDLDGNQPVWQEGTNLSARVNGGYLEIYSRTDFYGIGGFNYILEDPSGARSIASVEVRFDAVNDAPRGSDRVQQNVRFGRTSTLTVGDLMRAVYDVEGDSFGFAGLHIGLDGDSAANGTAVLNTDTNVISFTPDAEGYAAIAFDVIDERGAASTLSYLIRVLPANYAPRANTTGLRSLRTRSSSSIRRSCSPMTAMRTATH